MIGTGLWVQGPTCSFRIYNFLSALCTVNLTVDRLNSWEGAQNENEEAKRSLGFEISAGKPQNYRAHNSWSPSRFAVLHLKSAVGELWPGTIK